MSHLPAGAGHLPVPAVLVRNAVGAWGDAGRVWLAALDPLRTDVLAAWELSAGTPFALSYHWVEAVTRADGTGVVLKLGPPGSPHLAVEAAALRAWAGRGAVRLLEFDHDRGALLLERAEPGTSAATLVPDADPAATDILVDLMRDLHAAAVPAGVPALETLADGFAAHLAGPDGPLPRRLVTSAAGLFRELCADAVPPVLLHGDLHHDNVLRALRRPWLAIDPHGYVGDPGYDLGALLYNPLTGRRNVVPLLPARIDRLVAGTGIPRDRVLAWGFVQAVLSEVWSCEDGGGPDGAPLAVARWLEPLL